MLIYIDVLLKRKHFTGSIKTLQTYCDIIHINITRLKYGYFKENIKTINAYATYSYALTFCLALLFLIRPEGSDPSVSVRHTIVTGIVISLARIVRE